MTLPTYTPYDGSSTPFTIGLRQLDPATWLWPKKTWRRTSERVGPGRPNARRPQMPEPNSSSPSSQGVGRAAAPALGNGIQHFSSGSA